MNTDECESSPWIIRFTFKKNDGKKYYNGGRLFIINELSITNIKFIFSDDNSKGPIGTNKYPC